MIEREIYMVRHITYVHEVFGGKSTMHSDLYSIPWPCVSLNTMEIEDPDPFYLKEEDDHISGVIQKVGRIPLSTQKN